MKPNLSIIVLFLQFLALATINISFCNMNCHESERQALLSFKQDLKDLSNRLASWSGDGDCCTWHGVLCDKLTGHVLQVHLQNPFNPNNKSEFEALAWSALGGKINPSLLDLKDLIYLNLSWNGFEGIRIPQFLGSMGKLQYLDLSSAGFSGIIPHQLGNLSYLRYLDLNSHDLHAENIFWLSGLSLLEHLDLSRVNLSESSQWLQAINNLSVLKVLKLTYCQLASFPPLPIANFSSLTVLDLSGNQFSNSIPKWIFGLTNLVFLSLSHNSFEGPIPTGLQNLTSVRRFDLSSNQFNSSFPNWLHKFSFLEYLSLRYLSISGSIPLSLGNLLSLEHLDLSNNKLNGTITEIHFANLTRLVYFSASQNSLTINVSPDWLPPFQLEFLFLGSCHLGPKFPLWLLSQKNLKYLDISNSSILDIIPNRFWKVFPNVSYVDLSHNQILGELPNLTSLASLEELHLNSNNLSGPLPLISFKLILLDLSNNSFSGSIFQFLCHRVNESKNMATLDLSDNVLLGDLPDCCWMHWYNLLYLNLGDNNFTGVLPTSIGNLSSLEALQLRGNTLSGTIPVSLNSINNLMILDMSGNQFVGKVPTWIGERFSKMGILNLRSNKLHGVFPEELCRLSYLQILDLAGNNLSGTIPRCINNFSAMMELKDSLTPKEIFGVAEETSLVMKGRMLEYSNNLNLVRSIDLSKNNFSGEIPVEVTNLEALQSLNLSQNFLTGRIPKTIGAMSSIESLDFSGNLLSSEIPSSISNLTFLNHLNLSNNNLTGMIPLSTQLQSFDPSCFAGNELCGDPLPKKCTMTTTSMPNHEERGKDRDEHEVNWFYVSMPLGFVVGFWGVIGPLVANRRWRYKYCRFLDHLGNKLYFFVIKCF